MSANAFVHLSKPLSMPLHSFLLTLSVFGAYWWLHVPELQYYTLQVFVVSILVYFLLKRLSDRAHNWHILPTYVSLEMVVATFAFSLLIGGTGNTTSPFFPLTFIHLFLLVFSSDERTSIIITGVLMLFHYALNPGGWYGELSVILSLPVIMAFFLFAKRQYQEAVSDRQIIDQEEALLTDLEETELGLESFLAEFVQRKLNQIQSLLEHPETNKQALLGQLSILEMEIERKLSQLRLKKRQLDVEYADLEADLEKETRDQEHE